MTANVKSNVVLGHEALNKVATGIVVRYDCHMEKANIEEDDEKNPVALLVKDTIQIKSDILYKHHSLEKN